jgi:hypothetical protein
MIRRIAALLAGISLVVVGLFVTVLPASAEGAKPCPYNKICPNFTHIKWHGKTQKGDGSGSITLYDKTKGKGKKKRPTGKTASLYLGERSTWKMADPDWLKARASGGQGQCVQLRRDDWGRDTRYREGGVAIADGERHDFYTVGIRCRDVKRGVGAV